MPIIWNENKPPFYFCDICNEEITHYNKKMIILKEEVWLSIAKKKDVLCNCCIEKKLERPVSVSDLWISKDFEHSPFNQWFINKLNE